MTGMPPPGGLESVACDLCGGVATTTVTSTRDHAHGVEGDFLVVSCDRCGLHYLNPRPDPAHIGACYPSDYYAFAAPSLPATAESLRSRLRRLIRSNRLLSNVARIAPSLRDATRDRALADDMPGWVKPGKVLDVGCGSGAFLDGMADNGWTSFGIEPSAAAAAAARAKGHTVACQSATEPVDAELAAHMFDVIHMSHALEHVHSPTQALTRLHPLLRPGTGRLIVEVPNVESLLTYWYGELGLAFDTPRHLYLFSPDTLVRALRKCGFEIVSLRHVARPTQFTRCMRLLSERATPARWQTPAARALDDPTLLQALEPLARYAADNQLGGAIRAVALRH